MRFLQRQVLFESSGITAYDQFKYGWNNANGAFRYVIGRAMTRGKKPFLSMTGYVPNEKGVRRDESLCLINLQSGRNVLIVKLQRFWERRWLFYTSLTD